jgi:ribosomal protein L22
MRMMSAAHAQEAFPQLIADARVEPIALTEDGQPTTIVMSVVEYDRITGNTGSEVLKLIATIQANAAARGLDDAKLEALLADDS